MAVVKIPVRLTEDNSMQLTREELMQIVKEELAAVLEAKYHWNEPDWHYDGGYGDPEGPDPKWYMTEEELAEKKKKKKKKKGGKRDGRGAKNYSKDSGLKLKQWFKGGGWVQTGGKYDGKPCAKQPGQKTKPYCRDPDDRAKLSKKERDKRAAKKRKKDPNPNRKGKAKNVSQKDGRKKK